MASAAASNSPDDEGPTTEDSQRDRESESSAPPAPCGRHLFRKLVIFTSRSVVGLGMQLLVAIIFFFHAYISQVIQFTGQPLSSGKMMFYILIPVWFVCGFLYEYSILLLGRKIIIRWMGWRIVASVSLFSVSFVLKAVLNWFILFRFPTHDGTTNHTTEEFINHDEAITLSLLTSFALYFFALYSQMRERLELAKVYEFHTTLRSDVGHRVIKDTIEALAFDLDKSVMNCVEDCCSKCNMQTPEDIIYLVEELSTFVSIVPACRKRKSYKSLSPLEFRELVNQLIINLEEAGAADEESSHCNFKERSLPLSTLGVLKALVDKWTKVPLYFAMTCAALVVQASIIPLQATYLGFFIDALNSGDSQRARPSFVVWSSLILVSQISDILVGALQSKLNTQAIHLLKKKVLAIILNGGTEFSQAFPKAANTFSSQMGRLEALLITATYVFLLACSSLVLGIIFAFRLNAYLGFTFLVLIPIVYSIDTVVQKAMENSNASTLHEGEIQIQFTSVMNCVPVIRSCNAKNWIMSKMKEPMDTYNEARFKSIFWGCNVEAYYNCWGNVFLAVCVVPWGAYAIEGRVSSGDFATLVALSFGMIRPLSSLGGFLRRLTTDAGSVLAIEDLLHRGQNLAETESPNGANKKIESLKIGYVVKNVSFAYGSGANVLNGIDATFTKGTYTAICGGSGSGKSTLLELLMQNRMPSEGTVEWDGTAICDCTRTSFRNNVGVMFQKTMIINGSVYENIAFGMDTNLDKVKKAAEMAEISSVIESLPQGYNTIIGGGSIDLSGGQLQRICLARVLHRECSVLLLDEATSALDPVSEKAIFDTILRLRDVEGLTIISVTHHPVTTVNADEIIVLDKGIIGERGNYENLTGNKNGLFYKMVQAGNTE